jgi:putative phosphoribosyl transferase
LATLLFDLLTEDEAADRRKVFDVELLAGRLLEVTRWARQEPGLEDLGIGYFGASTGAAAALIAAADEPGYVDAIVSRGGRPDLAADRLPAVRAPTLLIVGGADPEVLRLNRWALTMLQAPAALEVIPGATHLFEEPGALERVAELSARWFTQHLGRR